MNLYLLEARDAHDLPKGAPYWGYDCVYGFVVCANDEQQARTIAAGESGDEGWEAWAVVAYTTCKPIAYDVFGVAGVVLRDFHAG